MSELVLRFGKVGNDPPAHINDLALTRPIITPDNRLKGIGGDIVVGRRIDAFPHSFDAEVFRNLLLIE
jgi:hypothetical protein